MHSRSCSTCHSPPKEPVVLKESAAVVDAAEFWSVAAVYFYVVGGCTRSQRSDNKVTCQRRILGDRQKNLDCISPSPFCDGIDSPSSCCMNTSTTTEMVLLPTPGISTVPEVLSVVSPATSFAPSTTTNYTTKKAAYFPNTIPHPETNPITTPPRSLTSNHLSTLRSALPGTVLK